MSVLLLVYNDNQYLHNFIIIECIHCKVLSSPKSLKVTVTTILISDNCEETNNIIFKLWHNVFNAWSPFTDMVTQLFLTIGHKFIERSLTYQNHLMMCCSTDILCFCFLNNISCGIGIHGDSSQEIVSMEIICTVSGTVPDWCCLCLAYFAKACQQYNWSHWMIITCCHGPTSRQHRKSHFSSCVFQNIDSFVVCKSIQTFPIHSQNLIPSFQAPILGRSSLLKDILHIDRQISMWTSMTSNDWETQAFMTSL